ncbi:MAG: choice-of-anchor F family protein [Thiobacillus sp.]|nr:choice-of-anchor F family protein [Thiobacillus sp.]
MKFAFTNTECIDLATLGFAHSRMLLEKKIEKGKYMFTKHHFAAATAALLTAGSASAAPMITGWSDVNVSTTGGTSTIYDRALPDPNARSSGRIGFDGTETFSPGLKVVNDAAPGVPPTSGNVFNCIMASSNAGCNSERQSGKRFKLDRTGLDAIDLVFTVNPDGSFETPGNDGLYKVFQKFGNATGGSLPGFTVALGTGIGAGFQSSTADDGAGRYPKDAHGAPWHKHMA